MKCKVLHGLGNKWIEGSNVKEALGLLMDEKQNVTQQCALIAQKANYMLGCAKKRKSVGSRARDEIVLMLLCDL